MDTNEAYLDSIVNRDSPNTEISGMGGSMDFPSSNTPGYTKNTGTDYLPSDAYEDPDKAKAKKRKRIKRFKDFIKDDEK